MSNDNLEIWNALGRTDPKQTKSFTRGGGFKGTAIKPIYTAHKMTEQFGPAGKGWGMGEPKFEVVQGYNGEVLVYCTVGVWWGDRGKFVYGVGGDKIVTHIKANEQYNRPERWENDDEAFKKAFTDAVGNGMKQLGMSADVHMGLFDDSKYVREVAAELAGEAPALAAPEPAPKPKAQSRETYTALAQEIDACATLDELAILWGSRPFQTEMKTLPTDWLDMITNHRDARKAELSVPTKPRVAPNFDNLPQGTAE